MTSQQPRPSRPRSTLIYDTGEREDDALEKMRWVVPAVFLGALLVFFFSVVEWLSPALPLLLFLGLVWLPVAGFVVWRTRGVAGAKVVQAVLILAAFGLPLAAWAAGPYRVAVMLAAGELIPQETMSTAIDDGSEGVASRACKRMLATEERQRVTRVSEVLTRRPQVAVDCLASLEDIQQGALVHIGQTLRQNWYQQWMNPADDSAADGDADAAAGGDDQGTGSGCAEAGAYPEVARLYGVDGTPTLLMCALRAPDEQTTACCAESLSTAVRDEQRLVVEPQTWSADFQADLFGALADKVDLPAEALLADEAVDDSLRWTTGELFHWTSHLGCHLMETSASSEGIARRLSKTIDTQCGLEVGDPLFSFAAVSLVSRTCEQAVGAERRRPVDVVQWCDAARQANGVTAVETAQFLVHKAIANQGLDELKRSMDRGAARAARQAEDEPIFSVDGGRRDIDVGTDGVRQRRPQWADHTPESKERLEAMESERRRRRQEVRQGADEEVSTGEADRQVSEQMRQELLEMRRAQEEDDDS